MSTSVKRAAIWVWGSRGIRFSWQTVCWGSWVYQAMFCIWGSRRQDLQLPEAAAQLGFTLQQSICSFSSGNYLQTLLYNQRINELFSSSLTNSDKCWIYSYLCHPVQDIPPGCLTWDVKALKDVQCCDQCRTCMWRWGSQNKMTCEGKKRKMKFHF